MPATGRAGAKAASPKAKSAPTMRRDAQQRREALIGSAALCFAEKGYTVPLEEIADRAGVGRGTLYRNFRDRTALALAVFERDIAVIEQDIDLSVPIEQALSDILHRGARASALFTRLAIELPLDRGHLDEFQALGQRVVEMLKPLVQRAHEEALLRRDVGAYELLLCMRMISGLLLPQMSDEEVSGKIAEALGVLVHGLRVD